MSRLRRIGGCGGRGGKVRLGGRLLWLLLIGLRGLSLACHCYIPITDPAQVSQGILWEMEMEMEVGVEKESSYGPISDGVTGSEGGGGRLISVGVVILMDVIGCLEI
jgi:hypothetical protein